MSTEPEASDTEREPTTWTLAPDEFAATKDRAAKINARAIRRGFTGRIEVTGTPREITETDEAGLPRTRIVIEALAIAVAALAVAVYLGTAAREGGGAARGRTAAASAGCRGSRAQRRWWSAPSAPTLTPTSRCTWASISFSACWPRCCWCSQRP